MIADYLLEELLNIGVGVAKSKINKKIDEQSEYNGWASPSNTVK